MVICAPYKTLNFRFGFSFQVTSTQVPEPNVLEIWKSAPIASERSRMIRNPKLVGLLVDMSKPTPLSHTSKRTMDEEIKRLTFTSEARAYLKTLFKLSCAIR